MNKSDLIAKLSEECGLSSKDAKGVIEALFSTEPRGGIIANALETGEKVQITGFGTFEVRDRKARTGRNPRTGEAIQIDATRVPAFSAGKSFKDRY
ncbi:MAG: HU family DNA-binding protein [Candidatus Krumholzibacteria bacterium]|jgi:DNA-binding protein HU-beta|nr:HU family DNA-binding protein [Candidatus Krumholzibacteria bacterium]MDP6668961.1 HU family DNA-binding protein [Candidatus Krumholzibacteria bacterium]MDP6797108.1 HU family DNA-binding protein [Candidatus Krumholzibacteria bacterium]MDP7022439.1 HU family DNA-binding protein [Candidatus Krumholzibacteria bacterium]